MHPRLAEEWADILAAYSDATYLSNPERVELTVSLIPGLYNVPHLKLAITVPPGYRAVGPDGFFVPAQFQLVGSQLPASDASGVGFPGWLLVSFHLIDANGQSTWRATADPQRGDNFVGYIGSIESFLARRCN
jgi:hypothetical protein